MSFAVPQSELRLNGVTSVGRTELLPDLGVAIDQAGGWVLERRTLAADALELVLEVSITCLQDLYAALLTTGIELSRDSHRAIAQRIACGLHMRLPSGISSIFTVCVAIRFLDAPSQSLHRFRLPHNCTNA